MLPASLAACVPVFMATPTSACASAGASFVPSPVIATSRPPACSRLISAILSSGVASARKSSTPASAAIAAAVSGLSPVIITVRMPMSRSSSKRSRMPLLHDVLELDHAEHAGDAVRRLGDGERRAAFGRDAVGDRLHRLGHGAAELLDPAAHGVGRALAHHRAVDVDAAHAGLRGERHEHGVRQLVALERRTASRRAPRSSDPRASRRRGSRPARPSASSGSVTPGTGMNAVACRLPSVIVPVLSSSSVGDVARRLDRAARHREHVALHEPVHARDADGGEQRADRRRDEAHQQRDEHDDRLARHRCSRRTAAASPPRAGRSA